MGSSKSRALERFESVSETPTGARFKDSITYEEWKAYGLRIATQAQSHQCAFDSCQWKIGDWLNFGEDKYGDQSVSERNALTPKTRYESAMDSTGYVVETLRNIKSICRKVSFRNDALTFSHHVVVATLSPEKQRKYLTMAAKSSPRMSVSELRRQVLQGEATCGDETKGPARKHNSWIGELALVELQAKQEDIASWSRDRCREVLPEVDRVIGTLQSVRGQICERL
jgi:hypothetical protein